MGAGGISTESWTKGKEARWGYPRIEISEVLLGSGDVDSSDSLKTLPMEGWVGSWRDTVLGVLLGLGGSVAVTGRLSGATPSEVLESVSELEVQILWS